MAEALQALLAQEHAAIHLYGVIGPRLPERLRERARGMQDDHRRHRDVLEEAIRAAGEVPAAALPAYAVPPGEAGAVAVAIERALVAHWHGALGSMPETALGVAVAAYVDEATHLALLRGSATAFPGR